MKTHPTASIAAYVMPQSETMVLSQEELVELTDRTRHGAQARVLRSMGMEYRRRPDGSLVVLRAHAECILSGSWAERNVMSRQPDWNAV